MQLVPTFSRLKAPKVDETPQSEATATPTHDLQFCTAICSVIGQAATIVVSVLALAWGDNPSILEAILITELSVSLWQLGWYLCFYTYFRSRNWDVSAAWRYWDWFVTTPFMLLSLVLFIEWEANSDCTRLFYEALFYNEETLSVSIPKVVFVALMLLLNWYMLYLGLMDEKSQEYLEYDQVAFGFVFLFVNFGGLLLFSVTIKTQAPGSGIAAVVVTFVVWTGYGVVAWFVREKDTKHALYNVLDIFSKNVVGLVVGAISLGNDYCRL